MPEKINAICRLKQIAAIVKSKLHCNEVSDCEKGILSQNVELGGK
jgi:hypothetical protein